MADTQTLHSSVRMLSAGVNTASKIMSATTDAVIRFLESRSFASREAKIMSDCVRHGGQLGCVTMNRDTSDEFHRMLQAEKIPSFVVRFKQTDGNSRYGIIYRREEEDRVMQLREQYLASKHLIFNVSLENLKKMSKGEFLQEYSELSYAEMCKLKERMTINQMMFSARKDGENRYRVFVREEDKAIADMLYAGVRQEKDGIGKKIFEQMDYERIKRQEAVNKIIARKENAVLIGSRNGNQVLYADRAGLWYEQAGTDAFREFVARDDGQFEKKLCIYMDNIRFPYVIDKPMKPEWEKLFKQLFSDTCRSEVMDLDKAMKVYGFREQKELEHAGNLKTPREKMKDDGKYDRKDQLQYEAAYCRLRAAVDLIHTKKDKNRIYVSEAQRQAYEAESKLRMEFEYCVNRGFERYENCAEQYIDEALGKEQMAEYVKDIQKNIHFTVDDMRRKVVWKESYEMPEYVDKDKDGIFDEFDQDIQEKNRAGQGRDYGENDSHESYESLDGH